MPLPARCESVPPPARVGVTDPCQPSLLRLRTAVRQRPLDLVGAERLDPVTDLEVVVVLDRDAALETLADLAHVILEPLERREIAGEHCDTISHHPRLGGTLDGVVGD